MAVYVNPVTGNREVWSVKPLGYITQEEWNAAHPHAPAPVPEGELWFRLRSGRDSRLARTDYLLMPDYQLEAARLEKVKAYRQALRDLPAMPGAPWDGGGEQTPWPVQDW